MAQGTHAAHARTTEPGAVPRRVVRLVPVLAAVVVCVLLIALALARPDSPSPSPAPAVTFSVQNEVAPSTTAGAQPGPPVRAARSKAGAVNAAADYATLLAQLFPLELGQARAVVAEAASADARERLVAAIDANLAPLQEQSTAVEGTTTYRQAVLATRLVSYSPDTPANADGVTQDDTAAGARARVSVWTLLTVSQTPQSPEQNTNAIGSFATVSLSLTWERGAWRIADSTTLDGPTPLIDGTPSTGSALDTALRGFTDWRP